MTQPIGIPSILQPVVQDRALITSTWFRFLQLLWMRSGGNIGVPTLPSYTVATLPTGLSDGAQAIVTDANSTTFHATAVGGGANIVPVTLLGGLWRIA